MKTPTALSLTLAAACAAALVQAAPSTPDQALMKKAIIKRAAASNYTDADILQYALTLEHLEATFYREALSKYSSADFVKAGFPNTTYADLVQVRDHEAQHVTLLTGGLTAAGATPVSACNYSFPYTDPKSFLALSQVIEGVGVSAYLGAAAYIANADYLTIAASILTVEARHNSLVRYLNGADPFPTPEDTPQTPREVVSIAGAFFVSCPTGSAPTIMPFPALKPGMMPSNLAAGAMIPFTVANGTTVASPAYCAFANGLSVAYQPYTNGACAVPKAMEGQTYVVLTSSNGSLSDETTIAGPAILELPSLYSADSSNSTFGPGTGVNGSTTTSANGTTSGSGTTGTTTRASSANNRVTLGSGAALAGVMAVAALLL